jgi:predicted NUDIX family NTP pyrophosphohydrolase
MKKSAGILLYRKNGDKNEVMLVHPGGPFWKNKDAGAWSIPKGEFSGGEEPLTAAIREFEEELGSQPKGNFIPLKAIKQKSGKVVYAWAVEGDLDVEKIKSNVFEMEWPPGSGKRSFFPEVDKADWFSIAHAKQKINGAQVAFLNELHNLL